MGWVGLPSFFFASLVVGQLSGWLLAWVVTSAKWLSALVEVGSGRKKTATNFIKNKKDCRPATALNAPEIAVGFCFRCVPFFTLLILLFLGRVTLLHDNENLHCFYLVAFFKYS